MLFDWHETWKCQNVTERKELYWSINLKQFFVVKSKTNFIYKNSILNIQSKLKLTNHKIDMYSMNLFISGNRLICLCDFFQGIRRRISLIIKLTIHTIATWRMICLHCSDWDEITFDAKLMKFQTRIKLCSRNRWYKCITNRDMPMDCSYQSVWSIDSRYALSIISG